MSWLQAGISREAAAALVVASHAKSAHRICTDVVQMWPDVDHVLMVLLASLAGAWASIDALTVV